MIFAIIEQPYLILSKTFDNGNTKVTLMCKWTAWKKESFVKTNEEVINARLALFL